MQASQLFRLRRKHLTHGPLTLTFVPDTVVGHRHIHLPATVEGHKQSRARASTQRNPELEEAHLWLYLRERILEHDLVYIQKHAGIACEHRSLYELGLHPAVERSPLRPVEQSGRSLA